MVMVIKVFFGRLDQQALVQLFLKARGYYVGDPFERGYERRETIRLAEIGNRNYPLPRVDDVVEIRCQHRVHGVIGVSLRGKLAAHPLAEEIEHRVLKY